MFHNDQISIIGPKKERHVLSKTAQVCWQHLGKWVELAWSIYTGIKKHKIFIPV